FLFIIFVISGYAQTAGSISGTVTFAADKSPLHGASVRIVGSNKTAVADDDGRFSITNLPPGKYTLIVHQEGFADVSRSVIV
ncbi:carboxypeptidase-like regulatory domain-containing protein, partial [Escherichia coli]|nr:carboxypeptidase-like regulatory domain-containing protein [Escherichia coli]